MHIPTGLEQVFAASHSALCILRGPEYRWEAANPVMQHQLFPERDLIGKTVREVIPDIYEQGLGSLLDLAYATGEPQYRHEMPLALPEQDTCYYDLVVAPIRDGEERVTGLFVTATDVNKHVQARQALERAEAKYRSLFENAVEGIFQTRVDGSLELANASLARIFGYASPEEMMASVTNIRSLVYTKQGCRQELFRLLEGEDTVAAFESEARRKDGSTVWVSTSLRALRAPDGTIVRVEGRAEDITVRKQAEQQALALIQEQAARAAAEQAQQQVTTVLERITGGFVGLDTEWRFTYLNHRARQLARRVFHVEPEQLYGAVVWQAIPSLEGSPFEAELRRAVAEQEPVLIEEYYTRAKRWFGVNLYPAPDGVSIYFHDITERKEAEAALRAATAEAEQANRAKSEFLSRMSHELRTPLNAVLGFAQLLGFSDLNADDRDSLSQILKAGNHLLGLINDVLDIVRIDAGRLSFSLEPLLVEHQLQDAINLMRPLADQHHLALHCIPNGAESCFIRADRQRLHQVLINLLANAIKYTPSPGTVTLTCQQQEPGWLQIQVRDTGPGLAPQDQLRLFIPFERLGAETRGIEGTGLGLAHAKRLTEAMCGTIGLESEVGKGSTFWVAFPLVDGPQAYGDGHEELELPHPTFTSPSFTLLYIEDNISNTQLIERIIARRPDIVLHTVAHGELGLEIARAHRPDLILLDLHLPDLPGWEVLAHLKADPATSTIPVVILSADATPRQIERLRVAGAYAYLTKPLDIRQFITVLDETLRDSS
jgi:PAS domain S-box-containing protein